MPDESTLALRRFLQPRAKRIIAIILLIFSSPLLTLSIISLSRRIRSGTLKGFEEVIIPPVLGFATVLVIALVLAYLSRKQRKETLDYLAGLSTAQVTALVDEFAASTAFHRGALRIGHTHLFCKGGVTPCSFERLMSLYIVRVSDGDGQYHWALELSSRDARTRRLDYAACQCSLTFNAEKCDGGEARVLRFNNVPLLRQALNGGQFTLMPDNFPETGLFAKTAKRNALKARDMLHPLLNAILAVRPDLPISIAN